MKGNTPPLSTVSLKYSLFHDCPFSFMIHISCLAGLSIPEEGLRVFQDSHSFRNESHKDFCFSFILQKINSLLIHLAIQEREIKHAPVSLASLKVIVRT